MLYIFDEPGKINEEFVKGSLQLLSEQRKNKASVQKTIQGRAQCIMVYLLLRYALHFEYNINEAVEFDYLSNGKPVLTDYPHIHFSLSHCKAAVCAALSTGSIGADIQEVRPVTDRLARRVLTDNEYTTFLNSKAPDDYFCKIWTIKESYIKKTGQGLAAKLNEIETNSITDITLFNNKNYYCCVTEKVMEIKRISIDKLFFAM